MIDAGKKHKRNERVTVGKKREIVVGVDQKRSVGWLRSTMAVTVGGSRNE